MYHKHTLQWWNISASQSKARQNRKTCMIKSNIKPAAKITIKLWKSWKLTMCKSPRIWFWLVNWFKGLIQFEEPSLQYLIWINGKKNTCVHMQKSIKSWNWFQATWFDLMHSTDSALWSKGLIQSSNSVPLPLNSFHNPTKMVSTFFFFGATQFLDCPPQIFLLVPILGFFYASD